MSEPGDSPSCSARISQFVAALSPDDVPEPVRHAAVVQLLDTLGCGLAAVGTGAAGQFTAMARAAPPDRCSVLGVERLVSPETASLANAALFHALDFDDTHPSSICHITAVVASAALAVAEAAGTSGAQLITAIVAGNEVVARVGAAAAPAYMRTGFHHTSVCGSFGAAAAAARLLGLDRLGTQHALGICGSLAAGSQEYLGDGSTAKIVNIGAAAQAGVVAAVLAAHGGDGPASVFEGRFGLYASYFRIQRPDLHRRLDDLGVAWETLAIAFKPYPACHFVHSSIDATREAAQRLGVLGHPDAIEQIEIEVPEPAVPIVLEPRATKVRPRTPYDGKFSLQYSVAAMAVHGSVGVDTYSPAAIADPDTLQLAKRVVHRSAVFETYPSAFPARVTVRTSDRSVTVEVPYQRGSAERPLTDDAVVGKFEANAALALDDDQTRSLSEQIQGIDVLRDVSSVTRGLARAAPRTMASG